MTSASTPGKMEGSTKGSIKMIRSTVMVCTLGVIRRNIQDGGTKESNMDSECLFQKRVPSTSMAFGKMAKKLDGLPERKSMPLRADKLKI